MKKISIIFIMVLLVAGFYESAFAGQDVDSGKKKAKWTFMVFLNSDNNLNGYADWNVGDIGEMKQVGSSDDVNIVVLHDRKALSALKLFIKKGKVEVIEDMGEIDMGDYREVVKFVRWAAEKYPAEKYLLDIWNHGDGWEFVGDLNRKRDRAQKPKGISYDYDSGNYINTPDLGKAISEIKGILGQNLDVFGMDACQMQVMEVAYELKDNVNYIVASQEAVPADGWPYDKLLKPLVENPAMTARELALNIVYAFDNEYKDAGVPVTHSVIDCSKLEVVYEKIDQLACELYKMVDEPNFVTTIYYKLIPELQYYDPNTFDLIHLCQLLIKYFGKNERLTDAANQVMASVCGMQSSAVIANIHYTQYEANSNGLSIYFPQEINTVPLAYGMLKFSKNYWADFIRAYVERLD